MFFLLVPLLIVPLDLSTCTVTSTCTATEPGSDAPVASWLTMRDSGRHLRLERGYTIRFEGVGRLEFGADRTLVRAEPEPLSAFVNGERVRGRRMLADGDVLDLRAADGTAWTIRLASEDEVGAVTDATRIRDDHPDGPARIDTDEPTVFFLRLAADGATFIHPETD